ETAYAIEKATPETVTIDKRFVLKTHDLVDGKPRFEILGEGKLTWDVKVGLPAKLDFQQRLFIREGNTTEETPIKVTFKRLDEADRARLAASVEGAGLFPNEPLSDVLQTQVLADLKSGEKVRYLKAMTLLSGKESAKPNTDIAQALEAFLGDKDQSVR